MNRTIVSILRGTLRGPIWWPVDQEMTKDIKLNLTTEREGLNPSRAGSLRYLIIRALADGDFQYCTLDPNASLTVTVRCGNRSKSRTFSIEEFPSVADCLGEKQ